MIDQLFGSKTRVKLLKLFFTNPNRSFYVREITRTVEEQINSVRRELANLLALGLITSDSTNNKLYYEVNQDYEHFEALKAMFSKSTPVTVPQEESTTDKKTKKSDKTDKELTKEAGEKADSVPEAKEEKPVELPEAERWKGVGNITGVAYSGVYTRDETANVDILVIGDANISKVESVIVELEKEKNRELRYAVIETDEWRYRGQVRDKFWLQFMGAKKQVVLDKDNVFNDK